MSANPWIDHNVTLSAADVDRLREWLDRPQGRFTVGRQFAIEITEDGCVVIRTRKWMGQPR